MRNGIVWINKAYGLCIPKEISGSCKKGGGKVELALDG